MNDVTWQLPDGSSLTANSTNVTLSLNNTVISAEILSANGPQHRGNVSVTVSTEAGRRTVHFNVLVVGKVQERTFPNSFCFTMIWICNALYDVLINDIIMCSSVTAPK